MLSKLISGTDIAVITDAGTPGISDPGEELVRQCYEAGVRVVPVPGACAAVNALIASGLPTRRFCFEAFLPVDKKERQAVLAELKDETRTIIIYEAPHRLRKTLEELSGVVSDRRATICRELTKKHEQFFQTTIQSAAEYYLANEPKGECIIVMEGVSRERLIADEKKRWEDIDITEHLNMYISGGMDKKEATKQVAKDRGIPKREVYEYAKELSR